MSLQKSPTPSEFRSRFPIFRNKIYLNSCSKGALSEEVQAAYASYLDSWREKGSAWEDWVETQERTRAKVARFIGASEDEVAVSFCASTALAGLASALSYEGARRRILLDDLQFPTVAHNWLAQARRGAVIGRVRAQGQRLPVRAFQEALDDSVLLASVTHVGFRNGYRQDLAAVVAAARDAGALTLIDDYQSSGTCPLDVHDLGCDFLVTGCLKYLLGSSGLAFLYARRELLERLEPTITGWFGQEKPYDFDIERATYHHSARRFETGTPPVPNLYAGLAGLDLLSSVDPSDVERHLAQLSSELIARAKDRGWSILTPEEPERRGPLVVIEAHDADRLVSVLGDEGIVVSARGNGLRASFHYYNTPEDVGHLVRALDAHADLVVAAAS